MKKLFLSLIASAIAISSFSLAPKMASSNESEALPSVKKMNREVPGDDDIYTGPTYRDADNGGGHNDDTWSVPNRIGNYGKIKGTLICTKSWMDLWQEVWDEDWFLFTTPRRANYTFTFSAPDYYYNLDVYRFEHGGHYISNTEDVSELVWRSTGAKRSVTKQLMPGSYYFRFYYATREQKPDKDKEYEFSFSYVNVDSPIPSVQPSNYVGHYANSRNEVIVWENDLVPSNVDRWGEPSQNVIDYDKGYLDPIFWDENGQFQEQYYVDSKVYIFDKTYLKEIADNCYKLGRFVSDVENKQIKKILIEEEKKANDISGALGVIDYIINLYGMFAVEGEAAKEILSYISLVFSTVSEWYFFKDLLQESFEFIDINFSDLIHSLDMLHDDCQFALQHDEYGVCLTRYARIKITNYDYYKKKIDWQISCFDPDFKNPGSYRVNKNNAIPSHFSETNCQGQLREYFGRFKFYKDLKDFETRMNFQFGKDVQGLVGENVEYETPTPMLKSITLDGDYKTDFFVGETFDYSNLNVIANYTDGHSVRIDNSNVTLVTDEEDKNEFEDELGCNIYVSKVNMNAEGIYPVIVSYKDSFEMDDLDKETGYVTKYNRYNIEVKFERVSKLAYSYYEIYGENLTYFNGHGDTFYYIYDSVPLPAPYGFEWDRIEYLGWYSEGNTGVYFVDIEIDLQTKKANIYLKADTDEGFETIYLKFKCERPTQPQELDHISLSGNPKTDFFLGEEFNYDGLIVTAHYTNGEQEEINDYNIYYASYNKDAVGTYTIIVEYTLKGLFDRKYYDVTVRRPTLVDIQLTGEYQTVFSAGEDFNCSGLKVIAYYDNDTAIYVDDFDYNLEEVDMNSPGHYKVKISYSDGFNTGYASYYIDVNEPKLESITLSNYKLTYMVGEEFFDDQTGIIVTAHYGNGSSCEVTDYEIDSSGVNTMEPGCYTVRVIYRENDVEVSTTYTVTIEDQTPRVVSIELSGSYKTTFNIAQKFSLNGLKIIVNYTDGSTKTVAYRNKAVSIDKSQVNTKKAGIYPVTVSYTEGDITVTTSYTVIVMDPSIPSLMYIDVLSAGCKKIYTVGEALDFNGLTVIAWYANRTHSIVNDFTVDTSNVDINKIGTYEVTVAYTENDITATATFSISVMRGSFFDDPRIGPKTRP